MRKYRRADQLVLKEPYTLIQSRYAAEDRCFFGILADSEQEVWEVEGRTLNRMLSQVMDIPDLTQRSGYNDAKEYKIRLIKTPAKDRSYFSKDEMLESHYTLAGNPDEIWVEIAEASLIHFTLVYKEKDDEEWSAEYSYGGGFLVEWYQKPKEKEEDEQPSEDVQKSVPETK